MFFFKDNFYEYTEEEKTYIIISSDFKLIISNINVKDILLSLVI
jgi:hypothetical protein